ncbi:MULTISPECIES: hypothetical protein [unclassified Lysinibacillus]
MMYDNVILTDWNLATINNPEYSELGGVGSFVPGGKTLTNLI